MDSNTSFYESPADMPKSARAYWGAIRERYTYDDISGALESLKGLRVLVLGDLVIDEYCYCRVSGTVSKAPVLAAIYEGMQRMLGGGGVIARHAAELASEVHYVGTVGALDQGHDELTTILENEGITSKLITWPGTHTVTKRRYITGGYPNPLESSPHGAGVDRSIRLFEIGFMATTPLPKQVEEELCAYLSDMAPKYDVVIVADFGHGLISQKVRETISARANWWSVNAQTNSSNFGFNRITKHAKADFVCIDELEARLPSGDRTSRLGDIVQGLRESLECSSIMVTRGKEGLVLFNGREAHEAPALANRVVDTVGAGDAVLAMASLCKARHLDEELVVLLGSCSGALAAWQVGNQAPVRKSRLLGYVESALSL